MQSESVAAKPTQPGTAAPSDRVADERSPRDEHCITTDHGKSAAKYLFKLSHDVILSLDRIGNILCINQRGVQLSGYSESELHGANIFERLLLPEDRQVAREMLADVLEGKARQYEVRWRTKDGAIVHFDGASVPRFSDTGEFLSTLCTLRDVTERKCAEEKLRKSEEKYRDLIEISPDAIFVVDANGICVLGNRAGAELAGVPQDELVGTPVTDTYLPEERHLFRERLEKLKTERTVRFERKFVRKNGEIVPVEVSVSGIRGGYFQAILRDISERKQSEALLAGEKRLLEMIATGVALKEILNALCLIIEEQRTGTLASVLLLNPDGIHLDSAAGPSLPREWMQQMESLPIGACAGSCGTAAYLRSQVIVSDIATDPLWDVPEHRSSALKHGLRASWSNPVLSSKGKVLGTFCMYYREARSPTSQDFELIELATHLVRIAIERDRAEAALRASEQVARGQVEALTYTLDVLATAPAPDRFLGQMLSTIGRLLSAQSVILWLLDESNDLLVLRAWAEGTNFAKADPEQALAHQAMLAIQLNEFAERSRQAAILEERNRMARDIHDTLAQGFTGVIVQLEALEDAIACCRRKEANEHLQRASELARRSLNEARRSVHALRPQALQGRNFWEALKGIIKNTTAGTALHTTFNLRGKMRHLPLVWQENLLHIGQEALTNALKYAHPRNFETRLTFKTKELRLELRDDGDGFKVKDRHDGFGLAGMRERVEQMGGTLKISSARGKGTNLLVTLPYTRNDGFPAVESTSS